MGILLSVKCHGGTLDIFRPAQILRRVPRDFLGWHELAGDVVLSLSRCELEVRGRGSR